MVVASELNEERAIANAYDTARRSWLWPIAIGFITAFFGQLSPALVIPSSIAVPCMFVVGATGLTAAIYALSKVPAVARRSVRPNAVAGLLLNGFIILGVFAYVLRVFA